MEDSLWRRCYCARFGHPKQREREREKRGESRSGGARGSGVGLGGSGGGPGRGARGVPCTIWTTRERCDRRRARRATCGTSSDRCNAPREAHRLTRRNCTRTTYSYLPRRTRRLSRDFARPRDSATAPIPRRSTRVRSPTAARFTGSAPTSRMRANRARARVRRGVPRESRGHGRHVGDVFHQRAVVRSHSRRGRGGDDGRRNTRGGRRGSNRERGWLGKCFEAGYGASSERATCTTRCGGCGPGSAESDTSESGEESE